MTTAQQNATDEEEAGELVLPPPPPLTPEKLKQLHAALVDGRDAASAAEIALKIDLEVGDLVLDAEREALTAFADRSTAKQEQRPAATARKAARGSADMTALACGMGLAFRAAEKSNVVVALLGRVKRAAAMLPALQIAVANKLPIIFVAEESPEIKRLASSAKLAELLSIPAAADDLVALYRVGQESIYHARMNGGPTLVICTGAKKARGTAGAVAMMQGYLRKKNVASELEAVPSTPAATPSHPGRKPLVEVVFPLRASASAKRAKRPVRR